MFKQHHLAAIALSLFGPLALGAPSHAAAPSDVLGGAVSLSASSYGISQSGGSVILTAQRNGGTHGAISVRYQTVDGVALGGSQYTPTTGTLTWADGDHADKMFTIPISAVTAFRGMKSFAVRLIAAPSTVLGPRTSATVNISGGVTPPPPRVAVTKSIRQWVSCDGAIDESAQLEQALNAASNNAFVLMVDCPVRFHTGQAALASIAVPDGVTISFAGAGEFLIETDGPPALAVTNPDTTQFVNWNVTYL